MSDSFVADHSAPPDLSPEMLVAAPALQGGAQSQSPTHGPPEPDMAAEMLTPARSEAQQAPDPAGPDFPTELLTAPAAPDLAVLDATDAPGGQELTELGLAPPPEAEHGPSASMPLNADLGLADNELTFEEKWDSLAQRLQASAPVGPESVRPMPPDLPDELLRPSTQGELSEVDQDDEDG